MAEIVKLKDLVLFAKREVVKHEDAKKVIGQHLPSTCKILSDQGLKPEETGPPTVYVFDFAGKDFDVAGGFLISQEIVDRVKETDDQKKIQLGTSDYYKLNHVGSYEMLGETWMKLMKQAKKDGRTGNAGFEKYINDPEHTKEECLITEVYLKIE
eukprot:gene1856-997_t